MAWRAPDGEDAERGRLPYIPTIYIIYVDTAQGFGGHCRRKRDRPGEAISEVIGKKKGRRQSIIVGADMICPCAMHGADR